MLYTRPDGAWTHRLVIRDIMTDGGVKRWTTKFIGRIRSERIRSKLKACTAVRGKPSRMNEADGEGVVGVGWDDDDGEDVAEEWDCVCSDGVSQPLVFSSVEMRSSITPSGTRLPAWISASA